MNSRDNGTSVRLGYIGLGNMGGHMVQRLLDAGYHLSVYDRTRQKAQAFESNGAKVADTPYELAISSDFVLSCVTNDEALASVMYGPQGALAGANHRTVFIDMSTVSPGASRRLYQQAQERSAAMIDAAVSGSVPQVEQGNLVLFVGGKRETYEQCKPILDVLGKESFHMGESGMGTSMKLVVNTLLGLGLQALAEAIVLGQKSGLDRRLLLDVLGKTTVVAPTHKAKLENAQRDNYPASFAQSMMFKDFGLILEQASALAVPMPATAAASQMYAAAKFNCGDEDYSSMIQFMEELAGISPRHA